MAPRAYDYIIIGSGASGAVVANRLSADPGNSVLVLEAGAGDTSNKIRDLGGFVQLWGSELDWNFLTEPQPGLLGRQITINQGKVLGGSTAINAMMYVRGNPRDFDMWNALGADGWSYADVLPYFKQLENFAGGASEYHGAHGPLEVCVCPDPAMRSEHFLRGATELGYDGPDWDHNGERQENGSGLLHFHITRNGTRASAGSAFLAPIADRPNLTIETEAEVERIVIERARAVAVEYRQHGELRRVDVGREVIVSAGAFLSPKLLMLSGIGPAEHLKAVGVPVVADLPGVGQNLQDHLHLRVVFRSKLNLPNTELLTGNAIFVKTREGMRAAPPDLQLNFTPSVPKPLMPVLDFGGPVCVFLAILLQPFSRGEVTLRSANPRDTPRIDPKYLDCAADLDALLAGIQLCREIANTKTFSALNGGELFPGAAADLAEYARSQASTLWHPAGTCKMGYDRAAVVDPRLRVHGVEGLRVADASVMPVVTSGNTAAPCYMIGEKAAAMILNGR